MDRHSVDWTGYIPAITTPFRRDGSIAWDDFSTQVDWLVSEKMHGVILAGTTGEWFSLSSSERAQLFAEGAQNMSGRGWVLGGCNAYTADEAILHARSAQRAGLDGILLAPPPYIVLTPPEIVQFYRDVSDATDIPICIYNWPRGCVTDIDVPTLIELAEIDHVVAVKNSTGDAARFYSGLYALSDRVRYFGLPTSGLGVDLASLGRGDGLMGAGGVLGADHPDFWRAIADHDPERALRLGARDRTLMESWFRPDYGAIFGNAQAIMKTALRLRGVPAGFVRRPLLELSDDQVGRVRSTLDALGLATDHAPSAAM